MTHHNKPNSDLLLEAIIYICTVIILLCLQMYRIDALRVTFKLIEFFLG